MAVSGRKYSFGPQGMFGSQVGGGCSPVFLNDSANQVFSAGADVGSSLRFKYKDTDVFRISGTRVTIGQFKTELTPSSTGAGDTVRISYNPNTDGVSEFEICNNPGAGPPSNATPAT